MILNEKKKKQMIEKEKERKGEIYRQKRELESVKEENDNVAGTISL